MGLRKSRKMRFLSGVSWLGFTAGVTDVPVTHRVGAGKITGLKRNGAFDGADREWFEFRGVRYTPKLKRFDYPRYLDPFQWEDVYDATEYKSDCVTGSATHGSEDCLFLNMLIPDSIDGNENRPVMIWIHGGAFVSGSGHGNDVPQNQAKYTDGRGL